MITIARQFIARKAKEYTTKKEFDAIKADIIEEVLENTWVTLEYTLPPLIKEVRRLKAEIEALKASK